MLRRKKSIGGLPSFALPQNGIPEVVVRACECILQKGAGQPVFIKHGAAKDVAIAKRDLENGLCGPFVNPLVAAEALYHYLQYMEEPLLSFDLYPELLKAAQIQSYRARLEFVSELFSRLPPAQRHTLQLLLGMLHRIATTAGNGVDIPTLATKLGPILLRSDKKVPKTERKIANDVVLFIINEPEALFRRDHKPNPRKTTQLSKDPDPRALKSIPSDVLHSWSFDAELSPPATSGQQLGLDLPPVPSPSFAGVPLGAVANSDEQTEGSRGDPQPRVAEFPTQESSVSPKGKSARKPAMAVDGEAAGDPGVPRRSRRSGEREGRSGERERGEHRRHATDDPRTHGEKGDREHRRHATDDPRQRPDRGERDRDREHRRHATDDPRQRPDRAERDRDREHRRHATDDPRQRAEKGDREHRRHATDDPRRKVEKNDHRLLEVDDPKVHAELELERSPAGPVPSHNKDHSSDPPQLPLPPVPSDAGKQNGRTEPMGTNRAVRNIRDATRMHSSPSGFFDPVNVPKPFSSTARALDTDSEGPDDDGPDDDDDDTKSADEDEGPPLIVNVSEKSEPMTGGFVGLPDIEIEELTEEPLSEAMQEKRRILEHLLSGEDEERERRRVHAQQILQREEEARRIQEDKNRRRRLAEERQRIFRRRMQEEGAKGQACGSDSSEDMSSKDKIEDSPQKESVDGDKRPQSVASGSVASATASDPLVVSNAAALRVLEERMEGLNAQVSRAIHENSVNDADGSEDEPSALRMENVKLRKDFAVLQDEFAAQGQRLLMAEQDLAQAKQAVVDLHDQMMGCQEENVMLRQNLMDFLLKVVSLSS